MLELNRQKIYNRDFSGQDLSHSRLKNSLFHNCNFDRANLTEADCEGSEFYGSTFRDTICYRTNFKDAKLAMTVFEPKDCFGMTMTMACKTYDGMKISPIWWHAWLMFMLMMQPSGKESIDLKNNIISLLGQEKYLKLKQMFSKREI
jgi:hypothetical protein